VLHAAINPNGLSTNYHFEYGTSSSLGSSTPEMDAGSSASVVAVRTLIEGLLPATPYFWKVVAINSVGTSVSPVEQFTTYTEFIFPHSPGTAWAYMYHSYYNRDLGLQVETQNGVHQWQVESFVQQNDSALCVIRCSQQDTVHQYATFGGPPYDTTFVSIQTGEFTVTFYPYSIHAAWIGIEGRWGDPIYGWLSRSLPSGVDTTQVQDSRGCAKYSTGTGLTDYNYSRYGNTIFEESLSILSVTPK
jgi:hypothetical protein